MGISSDIRKSMSGTNTHLIEPQGTIKIFHKISVILLVFLVFVGCSQRRELAEQQAPFHFPPYTRHLKDFKICLDPGHGGQGHVPNYKRGPTGVREAEVNLRVALYLRELLQEIGANVIMTRVDDSYVSLAMRSQIANESGADFFISLHHNGIDNPKTNYTSTWYHGDADDSRQSLDLARYIQLGVSDALELPTSPAAGLYSDKLITASGFGVLRMTECPAVLCEASFLSNPEEEARLQEDDYLRKEAYGYFLGIARYVEGGFPRGVLVEPQHASVIQTKTPLLQIQVKDGLHERGAWMLKRQQIFTDSIRVKIDGVSVPYQVRRQGPGPRGGGRDRRAHDPRQRRRGDGGRGGRVPGRPRRRRRDHAQGRGRRRRARDAGRAGCGRAGRDLRTLAGDRLRSTRRARITPPKHLRCDNSDDPQRKDAPMALRTPATGARGEGTGTTPGWSGSGPIIRSGSCAIATPGVGGMP